jgi:hypothetical protein
LDTVHLNDIFVMSVDDEPPMKMGGIEVKRAGMFVSARGSNQRASV